MTTQFGVHDFTNLYTTLPHDEIRASVGKLVQEVFVLRRAGMILKVTETGFQWQGTAPDGGRPVDTERTKFYDAARIVTDVDFILCNIFVTLGDDIYRQQLGVPMGFSCSPMLAVLMLAQFEITFVRRLMAQSRGASGSLVDTPSGEVALVPAVRELLQDLAVRTACSCRAIDDILLVDMSPVERRWVLARIYPASLELSEEYASPGPVRYLDMEVKHDRGGFYTLRRFAFGWFAFVVCAYLVLQWCQWGWGVGSGQPSVGCRCYVYLRYRRTTSTGCYEWKQHSLQLWRGTRCQWQNDADQHHCVF